MQEQEQENNKSEAGANFEIEKSSPQSMKRNKVADDFCMPELPQGDLQNDSLPSIRDDQPQQTPNSTPQLVNNHPVSPPTKEPSQEVVEDKKQKMNEKSDSKAKEKPAKPAKISLIQLFKYSSCWDKFVVIVGIIAAMCGGVTSPAIAVVFGKVIDIFDPSRSQDEVSDAVLDLFKMIGIISAMLWVFGYLQYACMQSVAEKISFDLRTLYLRNLLRQETEFFERQQIEALPSKIAEYFQAIGEGIGEKLAQVFYAVSMFIGGLGIALYIGPYFTLYCMCYLPVMIGVIAIFGMMVGKKQKEKLAFNAELGSHVEETLSAIKLVVSFAQEDLALKEYDEKAEQAKSHARKASCLQSTLHACFLTFMFGFFVYSYAVGGYLLEIGAINPATGNEYNIFEIVATSQATIMALMTFGSIFPIVPAIIKALVVGKEIFDVIERTPKIASPEDTTQSTDIISLGEGIKFEGVQFRYPTAPEGSRDVLFNANFMIKQGTSTAIVGPSGCGKSTIVQLINRLYDPLEGKITFDGTDVRCLDLVSLRNKIGYVSQEPVLILGTIRENLMYGNKDASKEDIEVALKRANVNFINNLENGLDTYVGAGSVQNLSGGQKQRIAIARALIKNPQILILDEATSALDPKSEGEVQSAISDIQEQSKGNLTVIMIAHRLQTIKTAQNLLYLKEQDQILAAEKDSAEYGEIIEILEKTNYAHQNEDADSNSDEANQEGQLRRLLTRQSTTTAAAGTNNSASKQNQLSTAADQSEEQSKSGSNKNGESYRDEARNSGKGFGWGRIFSYYSPKAFAFFMLFTAMIMSASFPILGYITSETQFVLIAYKTNPNYVEDRNRILTIFVFLCFIMGGISGLEKAMFGVTGENLTCSVRKDLIRGILFKQISWFDQEERAPGILSNVLSEDVAYLNGMTTETVAVVIEAGLGLLLGVVLSTIISWQMALFTVLCSPIMLVGVVAMSRLQWGNKGGKNKNETKTVDVYEKANALLSDVILNYKTVITFGQRNTDQVVDQFQNLLQEPMMRRVRNANLAGFFFGYSNCARMLFVGVVFWIGSEISRRYEQDTDRIYIAIWVIFSTCMGAGIAMSNLPSVQKAKASSKNIFGIIDEPSALDVRKTSQNAIYNVERGQIEFSGVTFRYPTRKALVLNELNMEIPATQKIALVGHSGCGKSTITNLLLKFYNLAEGSIKIDEKDLNEYDTKSLRKQIGFVMQEPILFNRSIKDNIRYGNLDATNEEIYLAAERANAIQFIETELENLSKEERYDLNKTALADKCKSSEKLATIAENIEGMSEQMIVLLLNVLKHADQNAMELIEMNPQKLIDLTQEALENTGTKWDDLVLKFEWDCHMESIISEQSFDQNLNEIVKQAAQTLKYAFNRETVESYAKSDANPSIESFGQFVLSDIESFKQTKQMRIDQLYQSFLDKRRNVDGTFQLNEGFDKNCGPKGSKLSGGQKQRIAIARALIKNPKILILDEATSALDEQSQEIVQQALDRAMEGRTAIVIAHRLSTIRNCERLFVLNDGKVVENGTYEELSDNTESYFYKLKSGMEM